jgi:hypothetical protein
MELETQVFLKASVDSWKNRSTFLAIPLPVELCLERMGERWFLKIIGCLLDDAFKESTLGISL